MKTVAPLSCILLLSFWGVTTISPPAMRSTGSPTRSEDTPSYSWQPDLSCGSACSVTLNGVDMVSATDGWAVGGEGTMLHWDGTRWQPVASPTTISFHSIDMVSARDGWIVGGDGWGGQGIILHWDGEAWQEVPLPATLTLRSVSMVSKDDGWAVGFRSATYGLGNNYILHWDGASWQVYDRTYDYGHKPVAVSMSGANDGWIATWISDYGALIRHWDGEDWADVASPIELNAVAAGAGYGGWGVGDGFVDLKSIKQWPTSPSLPLNGVALVSQSDAWAVGADGAIYHWDGEEWRSTAGPTLQTLRAVAMVSATDGWAVGDGGVILHYTADQTLPGSRIYLPLVVRD
jgi:hypothetical protein